MVLSLVAYYNATATGPTLVFLSLVHLYAAQIIARRKARRICATNALRFPSAHFRVSESYLGIFGGTTIYYWDGSNTVIW